MRKLIFIFLLFALPAFPQGFRIGDNAPITSSLTTPGQISTVTSAIINICASPANAVPCTNKATTFTSVTLGTPCATSTQVVLSGTNSCVGTTDIRGNWGAWVAAGNYDWTVTISTGQSFGPFTVSVGIPAGSAISPGTINGPTTYTGNNTHSGTEMFTGAINCTIVNAVRCISPLNPQGWAGSDPGAWINSAAGCSGGCKVQVAAGNYTVPTTIVLPGGVTLEGAGTSTVLNWTGSSSGVLIQPSILANHVAIKDLELNTAVGGTSVAIQLTAAVDVLIDHVWFIGGSPSTGFGTPIKIAGDGVSAKSQFVKIRHCLMQNYLVAGVAADHAIDTYLTDISMYASNSTAIDVLLDSGISGFYAKGVAVGNGLNGLKVQHTFGGASGTFNGPPWAMFFDVFLADSQAPSDGIVFDTSLGANVVETHFTNSWIASSGGNCFHIGGGQKISWTAGGKMRGCFLNGILIDSANVKDVTISNSFITSNNTSNTANTNGVSITAAAANVSLENLRIGNITEPFSVGHQKFAVSVTANAPEFSLQGSNLNNNDTGPYNSTSTVESLVVNNLPIPAGLVLNSVGSGAGAYTGTNTSYANVDTTNLCSVIIVPTGWRLVGIASGVLESNTGAVAQSIALSDIGTTCGGAGTTPINGTERIITPPAAGVFDASFSMEAVVAIGNGAAHAISLQAKTSNVADAWGIQNSSTTAAPQMTLMLLPSN